MPRAAILSRWRFRWKRRGGQIGPDFLYIGCQKAGSRWLYDQLADHAAFWMPPIKELHYFDGYEAGAGMDRMMQQAQAKKGRCRRIPGAEPFIDQIIAGDGGRLDLDWYASLFRWKAGLLAGDITPGYSTLSSGTIGLVAAHFPAVRLILFVRDPISRVWSHACQMMRRGCGAPPRDWPEMESFLTSEAVAARSYPSRIFARWREHVPAERVFVGFFDQLVSEPDVLRADVLRFLGAGASPAAIEASFDRKQDVQRVPCPPELQRRLADWFSDELIACAQTFGGPARGWPARYGLAAADG